MHTTRISYQDCLNGKYRYYASNPIGDFMAMRGANVTCNVFCGAGLHFGDGLFDNLVTIISAARDQNYEKFEILVPKEIAGKPQQIHYKLSSLVKVVAIHSDDPEGVLLTVYFPDRIWQRAGCQPEAKGTK